MQYHCDFLVVGSGFFGAVCAERLASAGRRVLVLEKRPHVGGNCWSEVDAETGIEVHKYGSHIFHTSNEEVWGYLNRFTRFNGYRHTVRTMYQGCVYPMPINLTTINAFYKMTLTPAEAEVFIKSEAARERIENPRNLEEKAISRIGRPLYEAFIKGYTIKQWEQDPKELPVGIITRLPVRYDANDRYFSDDHEGIPLEGYGRLFERLLDHPNIEVRLSTDYFDVREALAGIPTLYTGPVDRFFGYTHGRLDWRTMDLERSVIDVPDYQGCAVMNYADPEIPFTRVHEFKHYHPERPATERTVIFKEFSRGAGPADDPYYPVNTPRNSRLLEQYQRDAEGLKGIYFGGRLGSYRYLDMDDTVEAALALSMRILIGAAV